MKGRFPGHVFALLMLLSLAAGCGKHRNGSPADGGMAGREYTNRFFGFALPLPEGWTPAPAETLNAAAKSGQELIAESADKRVKAAMKAAEKQTHNLLLFSEHPFGSAVAFNVNIVAVAESVPRVTGVKTGEDYLNHMRDLIAAAKTGMQSKGSPTTVDLGGRTFFREVYAGTMFGAKGVQLEQAYYVSVQDRYALAFIVSASNPQDLTRASAALQKLRFQK